MRLIADFWLNSRKEVGAERGKEDRPLKTTLIKRFIYLATNRKSFHQKPFGETFDTDTDTSFILLLLLHNIPTTNEQNNRVQFLQIRSIYLFIYFKTGRVLGRGKTRDMAKTRDVCFVRVTSLKWGKKYCELVTYPCGGGERLINT